MSKKKILFAVLMGLTTAFVSPALNASAAENAVVSTAATQTGWVQSGATWYYYNNDGTKQTGWFQDSDSKRNWYHFDNNGAMQTGWFKDTDGKWYYLSTKEGGPYGSMQTGWFKDTDGNWYYLSTKEGGPYGSMQTGWFQDTDGTWYYLSEKEGGPYGSMQTGWIDSNGSSYYLKSNGAMAANEVVEGKYYVNGSGAWVAPKETKYMESTAYSGGGITASGRPVSYNPNGISTIAVDKNVISLGTLVYVEGYGVAVAADTGGKIKGNIIDVYFDSNAAADQWGRKYGVKVDILAYPGQW